MKIPTILNIEKIGVINVITCISKFSQQINFSQLKQSLDESGCIEQHIHVVPNGEHEKSIGNLVHYYQTLSLRMLR